MLCLACLDCNLGRIPVGERVCFWGLEIWFIVPAKEWDWGRRRVA